MVNFGNASQLFVTVDGISAGRGGTGTRARGGAGLSTIFSVFVATVTASSLSITRNRTGKLPARVKVHCAGVTVDSVNCPSLLKSQAMLLTVPSSSLLLPVKVIAVPVVCRLGSNAMSAFGGLFSYQNASQKWLWYWSATSG